MESGLIEHCLLNSERFLFGAIRAKDQKETFRILAGRYDLTFSKNSYGDALRDILATYGISKIIDVIRSEINGAYPEQDLERARLLWNEGNLLDTMRGEPDFLGSPFIERGWKGRDASSSPLTTFAVLWFGVIEKVTLV